MRRPACLLLCLFALVVSTTLLGADEGKPTFAERADRAIVQGSVAKLRALQSDLERRGNSADTYDIAYLDWRISQLLPRKAKKERRAVLKRAEERLDVLLETDTANAEAHALRGSVIGEQISGMFSGMKLGKKATAALNRALELAPNNPRVALQRGISFFFTPKSFGGGLPRAEEELQRAHELFAKEPAEKAWPNWGRVDVFAWLGQAHAKAGRIEEARDSYRAALKIEPEHRWVRDVLLPGLDGGKKRN